ncbi:hypothetical protein SAMD00019534_057940 [Acytostelium subglobosum LB1]|uniref:hypothetical protein n=1 Tax=Acytostelium subglobosum LB1 TaxID=1410327 RepID=UPI00064487E1|nr:hypothetical protein SAMD00019534_057940 [Acytostelium subglobosum LB1]GAM22619.1 hypothetical protein SAMD00019534_057940 [Acytostelium subglobosum LB1]|eukprot:XP_012754739.1 hypothetical protein SAMD00019534_057940 [Acytostelium subglobosum LB1]
MGDWVYSLGDNILSQEDKFIGTKDMTQDDVDKLQRYTEQQRVEYIRTKFINPAKVAPPAAVQGGGPAANKDGVRQSTEKPATTFDGQITKNGQVIQYGVVSSGDFSTSVFVDRNLNGVKNSEDDLVGGFTGTITQKSDGSVVDTFQVTAAKPVYTKKLATGDYCVKYTNPAGSFVSAPTGTDNVFTPAGSATPEYCFTQADQPITATLGVTAKKKITVDVFIDQDKNGVRAASDAQAWGFKGTFTKPDGTVIRTFDIETDSRTFTMNLEPGEFCVTLENKKRNWMVSPTGADNGYTFDAATTFKGKNCFTQAQADQKLAMGVFTAPEISFSAFIDSNKNGKDDSEAAAWGFTGTISTQDGGEVVQTYTTDGTNREWNGFLAPGNYCINWVHKNLKGEQHWKSGPLGSDNRFQNARYCFTMTTANKINKAGVVPI